MSKRYPGGIIRKTPQTPSQTSAQGIWDMASVTQAVKENTWPIAGVPDPISKSLRFRSSASAYLNRTPTVAGNRKTWTFSTWIKLGEIAASNGTIFAAGTTSGETTRFYLRYTGSQFQTGYGSQNLDTTSAVYRDPSAWYHLVLAVDTTQATAANRLKIYVNGVQQAVSTSVNYTQNVDTAVNNSVTHSIARDHIIPGGYFDGYLTETYLIDGQALTPSSFGNTNDQTGVWQPIAYTGTYGTNGFYLPFSNTASTSTLGYDFSGNSNNWTTNNISLTSGSTYDSMNDVPTQWIPYNTAGDTGALWRGNYCTLNPLAVDADVTLSNGNLNFSCSSAGLGGTIGTIAVTSGKWYWEVIPTSGSGAIAIGIAKLPLSAYDANQTGTYLYLTGGNKRLSPSTDSAYGASYTDNDVIGVALDMDAGTVTFYKNNSSQGIAFSSLSGEFTAWVQDGSNGTAAVANINFGQRPFSYTPPSGFKTLNTTNLPTPTIGATPATTANKYFNAVTYAGAGAGTVITTGFYPDFAWMKNRTAAFSNFVQDSVRGGGVYLLTDTTDADAAVSPSSTFSSTGLTIPFNSSYASNSSYNFVAWAWNANSGSTVSNTAGSITSTVSANTTAGFSIVTYTGTGSAATIGHGLGVAPSMMIFKRRNGAANWFVYHSVLGATQYIYLDATAAAITASGAWNNTAPTSTVFSVGNFGEVNLNTGTYVAYCFAQVAGYSAFGSYTGNGSSDGPFVHLGFRPRYIMVKKSSGESNWQVLDSSRSPYNLAGEDLLPNASDAEKTIAQGFNQVDMLSNGFKIRNTNCNDSGGTYIYACFAESPFKFALAR